MKLKIRTFMWGRIWLRYDLVSWIWWRPFALFVLCTFPLWWVFVLAMDWREGLRPLHPWDALTEVLHSAFWGVLQGDM